MADATRRRPGIARIKAAVRERDGMRCAKCGVTSAECKRRTGRQLEVHRIIPGSEYSTAPGVCTTLCRRCHGPEPRRKRGTPDLAYPGRVKCRASLVTKLRTISVLKARMGEKFKAVEFLSGLLAAPINQLHDATTKAFNEFQVRHEGKKKSDT